MGQTLFCWLNRENGWNPPFIHVCLIHKPMYGEKKNNFLYLLIREQKQSQSKCATMLRLTTPLVIIQA